MLSVIIQRVIAMCAPGFLLKISMSEIVNVPVWFPKQRGTRRMDTKNKIKLSVEIMTVE